MLTLLMVFYHTDSIFVAALNHRFSIDWFRVLVMGSIKVRCSEPHASIELYSS